MIIEITSQGFFSCTRKLMRFNINKVKHVIYK